MTTVILQDRVGSFAEDKDEAASIRKDCILAALKKKQRIVLDFNGITLVTQSFIHALIAQALRDHGEKALTLIQFKNCSPVAKGIVETVVQYVLESLDDDK